MAAIQRNADIKSYICQLFAKEDEDLLSIKESASYAGLPKIAISENVGKLIYIFTKLQKPKRILEVGTLAGYSTAWLAKGAPDAKIITLECDPKHATVARSNFKQTHLNHRIEIIEDDASNTLNSFVESQEEPFDLIFLDADKKGYPKYLPYLLKLSKPGTLLLTDNLIPREEQINQPASNDLEATNIYHYNSLLSENPNLETILITTIVGDNGRVDALGVSIINV